MAIRGDSLDIGLLGNAATAGVVAFGGAVGGFFSGDVPLSLDPLSTAGPPAVASSDKGDVAVDTNGVLWLCITTGAPGTWIKVSHGGTRYLSAPFRAYDSRTSGDGKLRPGGLVILRIRA